MTNGKGGNHDESVKHSQKGEDATNIKGGTGGSTEKLLPLLEELTGKGIGIGGCGGSGTPIDSCADGGYANKYQGKHGSFAGAGGGGGGGRGAHPAPAAGGCRSRRTAQQGEQQRYGRAGPAGGGEGSGI